MPESAPLRTARRALRHLAGAAEPYQGLIPSLLDRRRFTMLTELPPPIDGQRNHDRSFRGSNLIHDEPLLQTMRALGDSELNPAVDAYLDRFAKHCTQTVTGLFPWGEHSDWDLVDDCPGDSYLYKEPPLPYRPTHDHLRAVPVWLWKELNRRNAEAVQGFAKGLDYHWFDPEAPRANRHAPIMDTQRMPASGGGSRFPRHGGFYIIDLACAYSFRQEPEHLRQLRRFADHWWAQRDSRGLLPLWGSGVRHDEITPQQTLSLGNSLLVAAERLDAVEGDAEAATLAVTLRERAAVLRNAFLGLPHHHGLGIWIGACRRETGSTTHPPRHQRVLLNTVWGSGYGGSTGSAGLAAGQALACLQAYGYTGDRRHLDFALGVAPWYSREPLPEVQVPAGDAGRALDLFAELHRVTYESQTGAPYLLHGLARIGLMADLGPDCPLAANFT